MRRGVIAAACCAAALAAGCARPPPAGPPKDLVDARAAMAQARENPLATLAFAELEAASQALAAAEAEARRDPGGRAAEDLAYVARRKATRAQLASLYASDLDALAKARTLAGALRLRVARGAAGAPPAVRAMPSMPEDARPRRPAEPGRAVREQRETHEDPPPRPE